ncbi:MAG: lipoyl protein ligase domain-containing protein [Eisenbergiella sp.]
MEKKTEVIIRSVNSLGIQAEKSGRNDITVDGCKFSGNAYFRTGDYCYHHGTILLHADRELMEKYLHASNKKLESKGVDSIRSRVGNLCDWAPELNRERMAEKLKEAFGVCLGSLKDFPGERLAGEEISRLAERFSSWDWKYGRQIPFSKEAEERFSWGEMRIQLRVDGGRIQETRLFTDALDVELTGRVEKCLSGLLFQKKAVRDAIDGIPTDNEMQDRMKKDIYCLMESFF